MADSGRFPIRAHFCGVVHSVDIEMTAHFEHTKQCLPVAEVFRPHPGKFAAGFEYEHAGKSAGFEFDGDPSKQDMTNPVGWATGAAGWGSCTGSKDAAASIASGTCRRSLALGFSQSAA